MDIQESNVVELKQKVVDDIKKEVIAFANSNGGTLYVGVADDGTVLGIENPNEELLQITNMVRDAIRPDITMFVDCQLEIIESKTIIVVHVQKGTESPYYLAKKGIRPEGVYVRHGTSSVPATESVIRNMIKDTDGDNFEEMRSINQELTFKEASATFKARGVAFGEKQKVMLGLVSVNGVYTNLGLLLSDQCVHTVKVADFEGTTKSVFKDRKEFGGSLFQQMEKIYDYLDIYNRTRAEVKGLYRKEKRNYPEDALREVLLNSLIHRDYAFGGSNLISIFEDRIEFLSIGGLVKGLTMKDVLFGLSMARNQKLANVFYRLQLVEAYGTGMQKIMTAYEDHWKEPKVEVSDNAFKIVLPNRNYMPPKVDRVMEPKIMYLTRNEKAVLDYVEQNEIISRSEVEKLCSLSQAMAVRVLRKLVEGGYLMTVGKGKNLRYIKR